MVNLFYFCSINNTMKKLYIVLFVLSISMLSISNIYLWKDNVQQWNILNTQIQMLNKLLLQITPGKDI